MTGVVGNLLQLGTTDETKHQGDQREEGSLPTKVGEEDDHAKESIILGNPVHAAFWTLSFLPELG